MQYPIVFRLWCFDILCKWQIVATLKGRKLTGNVYLAHLMVQFHSFPPHGNAWKFEPPADSRAWGSVIGKEKRKVWLKGQNFRRENSARELWHSMTSQGWIFLALSKPLIISCFFLLWHGRVEKNRNERVKMAYLNYSPVEKLLPLEGM